MYVTARGGNRRRGSFGALRRNSSLRARRRGALGTISTMVNGSLVYGSDAVALTGSPKICPAWGCGGSPIRIVDRVLPPRVVLPVLPGVVMKAGGGSGAPPTLLPGAPGYVGGPVQTSGTISWSSAPPTPNPSTLIDGLNLAQITQLYDTNPAALSPAQFQALQAAGIIAGTVPQSSSSLVSSGATAIDPATQAGAAVPATGTDIGTMLDTTYAGLPLFAWLAIGAGAFVLFGGSGKRR